MYEGIQPPGEADAIDRLLEKHRRLAKALRRIIDLRKPQQRRGIRAQEEGDELDLDALIRAAIDWRLGLPPDTRIHQSHVKASRDIAVLLSIFPNRSRRRRPVPRAPFCS